MKFVIEIECDTAAFSGTEFDRGYEIARILKKTAFKINAEGAGVGEAMSLYDINGNRVGVAVVVK